MKEIMRAIGLMSGTSMDGIDVAFIETDGENHVKPLAHEFVPYESAFSGKITAGIEDAKRITNRDDRPGLLAEIEAEITKRHVDAVRQFLAVEELTRIKFDVVGFHGQTVLHRPEAGLTIQLGNGPLLAESLGIDVVYDMRANDMLHNGQGAPLVPVYHQALAQGLDKDTRRGGVGFVNIGGISNATFVFENADPIALDCGPGNALIDQWVQQEAGIPFDDKGRIAAEGGANDAVVSAYMALPYFRIDGPKSLDRGDFTLDMVQGMELSDGAATLAKFTAAAIAKSITDLEKVPGTIIVCGGGARNRQLVHYLQEAVTGVASVVAADGIGFRADMIEAESWAYLAVRSVRGLPLSYPSTTGCTKPVSGGVLAKHQE